uniref:Uncharacterized protein n=1 Tax=Solanum lycopersicum TaxID=4081 RepID=K4CDT4_SOLLC
MFKVTHVKKSTNPAEEERCIERRPKEIHMEGNIGFLNAELAAVANRERKREVEIATSKEAENKRYKVLEAQLTFNFESGNILPLCPASSDDGVDYEGDENFKGEKESYADNE